MQLRGAGNRTSGTARAAAVGLTCLAAAALLTGCSGGEDEPKPWPTYASPDDTGPQPSVSLAPTPPPKPAAAREGTPAGAQKFAKWYLQAYVYAYAHNDATPIRDVALPGCGLCQGIIDNVAKQKKAGHHVVGEQLTPTLVSAAPGGTQKHTVVAAFFDETGGKVVDDRGKTVSVYGSAKGRELLVGLKWDIVAGWRVVAGEFKDHI